MEADYETFKIMCPITRRFSIWKVKFAGVIFYSLSKAFLDVKMEFKR
ncbi:hypothetical protein D1BOALGB6SA_7983 [Olavius sp. associated proteobacterium Delta 1]|nr:hypothetical protein D1BOALGB6SA_7983 [Olavius sp. associated proteobacterium Delta 1]